MRLYIIMLLAVCPISLFAQDEIVRTGWHVAFTRIVLPIPSGSEWDISEVERGYLIQTQNVSDLDLRQVFDRIPQERVSNITQVNGKLSVEVVCDCYVDAFLWRPNRLVVDIVDGPPPETSLFDLENASISEPPELNLDPSQDSGSDSEELLEEISPLKRLYQSRRPNVEMFSEGVYANLKRGIDQGILDVNPENEPEPIDLIDPIGAIVPKTTIEPETEPKNTNQALGLQASTTVDIALDLTNLGIQNDRSQTVCWPDASVDVGAWATGQGFSEDVALQRLRLFSDLERKNPVAYRDLARVYVYYGFGAEALEIVKSSLGQSSDMKAVGALARLVDGIEEASSDLSAQLDCRGKVALWALLSSNDTSINPDINVDSLIQEFRNLPDSIRTHLTPLMSKRLADIGENEAASFLLAGGKNNSELQDDLALVKAQIAEQEGEIGEAEAALLEAPELEPKILIELVSLQISQGRSIDDTLLQDLESALYEFRASPLENELFEAMVSARVHRDDFSEAIATIDRFSRSVPESILSSATEIVLEALVDRGTDVLFLETAFNERSLLSTPKMQNKFSERLLMLGFSGRALELINGPANGAMMAERRLLRAEAYIQKREPELARKELAGVTTPEALSILRRATDLLNSQENTPTAALRQISQKSTSDAEEMELLKTAEELLTNQNNLDLSSATPLGDSEELLSQSALTRQTVKGLLEQFQAE